MNGRRYSDATGFINGTKTYDRHIEPVRRYHLMPGYKRFLYVRVPIMLSPVVGTLAVTSPGETALMAGGVLTLSGPRLAKYLRTRRFQREVVQPVQKAVDKIVGQHVQLSIPEDFRDNPEAKIRVDLPTEWLPTKEHMSNLLDIVSKKLAIEDAVPSWTLAGHEPHVQLAMPAKPASILKFQDAFTDMAEAKDPDLFLGHGARNIVVNFSLSTESPHLLIAGGSGAGKSELLANLAAQFLRRGYGCFVLDAKFVSHMWLRKVPGVVYASEAEDLHNALIWIDAELTRRARFVADGGDPDTLVPVFAILEEMNGATNRLRAYWRSIKESSDPMMSPALTALVNISSMGREMRFHVLMAGQSLTAKAVGGPENRENFGGRCFARATAAQWKMLAPQIKPAPVKRQCPGRWHIVVGDSLKEFQAPFIDIKGHPERIIEFATGGNPIPDMALMMKEGAQPQDPWSGPLSSGDDPTLELAATTTLGKFAASHGLTVQQLHNWKGRDPRFPQPEGKEGPADLYVLSALEDYLALRGVAS